MISSIIIRRDHHWVEYNSLGSVTRTGHLVDDPNSNTYRALRFFGSKEHGNTLYAEFTGASPLARLLC